MQAPVPRTLVRSRFTGAQNLAAQPVRAAKPRTRTSSVQLIRCFKDDRGNEEVWQADIEIGRPPKAMDVAEQHASQEIIRRAEAADDVLAAGRAKAARGYVAVDNQVDNYVDRSKAIAENLGDAAEDKVRRDIANSASFLEAASEVIKEGAEIVADGLLRTADYAGTQMEILAARTRQRAEFVPRDAKQSVESAAEVTAYLLKDLAAGDIGSRVQNTAAQHRAGLQELADRKLGAPTDYRREPGNAFYEVKESAHEHAARLRQERERSVSDTPLTSSPSLAPLRNEGVQGLDSAALQDSAASAYQAGRPGFSPDTSSDQASEPSNRTNTNKAAQYMAQKASQQVQRGTEATENAMGSGRTDVDVAVAVTQQPFSAHDAKSELKEAADQARGVVVPGQETTKLKPHSTPDENSSALKSSDVGNDIVRGSDL